MNRFLKIFTAGVMLVASSSHGAVASAGSQWVLSELKIQDEEDKTITEFNPIELVETPGPGGKAASVTVKKHELVIRVRVKKLEPQPPPAPPFDCTERPTTIRIKIFYLEEMTSLHDYYTRPENALAEDRVVFYEEVILGADNEAKVKWDGRITAAASSTGQRLIVRGDVDAHYVVEVSTTICDLYHLPAVTSFTVARPAAWLIGDAYPASYIGNVEVGNAPVPQGNGILDGFNAPSGFPGTFGLTARRGTLVNLLPEENGHDASAEKNSIHHAVLGRWKGSAVFIWLGHSYHGDWLLNYWGSGLPDDPIAEQREKGSAFSPLRSERPDEPKLKKAFENRFYDFPASMENTELVVIGACWSAKPLNPWPGGPNKGMKSMIDVCAARGADVSIGWTGLAVVSKVQNFLKVMIDHQASRDPVTGKYPSLDDSIDLARNDAGSVEPNSEIKVVLGYLADPKKIRLGDLPRYGLPINVQ